MLRWPWSGVEAGFNTLRESGPGLFTSHRRACAVRNTGSGLYRIKHMFSAVELVREERETAQGPEDEGQTALIKQSL